MPPPCRASTHCGSEALLSDKRPAIPRTLTYHAVGACGQRASLTTDRALVYHQSYMCLESYCMFVRRSLWLAPATSLPATEVGSSWLVTGNENKNCFTCRAQVIVAGAYGQRSSTRSESRSRSDNPKQSIRLMNTFAVQVIVVGAYGQRASQNVLNVLNVLRCFRLLRLIRVARVCVAASFVSVLL